jgi:tripartite-type tricarboxylate transporter receptor subunit TctC
MTLTAHVSRRRFLRLTAAVPLVPSLPPRSASAQTYPARPVRVIVTSGPGGQRNTAARLFAQKLTENLGQSFYIENMGGGGGNIAIGGWRRGQRLSRCHGLPIGLHASIWRIASNSD